MPTGNRSSGSLQGFSKELPGPTEFLHRFQGTFSVRVLLVLSVLLVLLVVLLVLLVLLLPSALAELK